MQKIIESVMSNFGVRVFDAANLDQCKGIIEAVESMNVWTQASLYGKDGEKVVDENHRKADVAFVKEPSPLHDLIKSITHDRILDYQKVFTYCKLRGQERFQVLRYTVGGFYNLHTDVGENEAYSRKLSAVLYLNDDYLGGELDFPELGFRITPSKGRLVLFPSNYIYAHAAMPVVSGIKYSVVTWLH